MPFGPRRGRECLSANLPRASHPSALTALERQNVADSPGRAPAGARTPVNLHSGASFDESPRDHARTHRPPLARSAVDTCAAYAFSCRIATVGDRAPDSKRFLHTNTKAAFGRPFPLGGARCPAGHTPRIRPPASPIH